MPRATPGSAKSKTSYWIGLPPPWGVKRRKAEWADVEAWFREHGRKYEHTRRITTFLEHPGFPVDVRHNSKIFREKLAVWSDRQLGPRWTPPPGDAA